MSEQNRGKYIVLEGGEGTGKTTQSQILAEHVDGGLTREPGGTSLGEQIRSILKDPSGPERDPIVDAFMVAASRAHLGHTIITPLLENGRDVISDRSWISSYAYQGASGTPKESILQINQLAMGDLFKPDLVILLDADPAQAHQRLAKRGDVADFYELKGPKFHQTVRELLLEVCELQDGVVIDAMQPVDKVSTQIMNAYRERFES